ncbi:MAG: M50 family metallopeptidase [Candidatus Paceibacterota bacterium]|jgi:hypothetical protein|nr:M50 family metallopeptidase [Candidatus Paceibacterota bacterium]
MNLGILLILITLFGYASNWINWQFLNYKLVRLLYFLGSFVHESSHAVLCLLTGAKIKEFKVFSRQPRVVHLEPKLPLLGMPLISLAPLFGGSAFLFLLNRFWLKDYFIISKISEWQEAIFLPFDLLSQINLLEWQSWVMIFIFLNVGAMIGPSLKDLKNFWPVLILFFFINSPALLGFAYLVLGLILTNLIIQLILVILIFLGRLILKLPL